MPIPTSTISASRSRERFATMPSNLAGRPDAELIARVDDVLKQVATEVGPQLEAALRDCMEGELYRTLHIQDGCLNHYRDGDELISRDGGGGRYLGNQPLAERVSSALSRGIADLRNRLFDAFKPKFYGTVVLTFEVSSGQCQLSRCKKEKMSTGGAQRK